MTINKTTTDLSTLKINYLTQEMYEDALENDEINENELYITPGSNTEDYIVEQGTSGIWTYRKWNSGVAECWGVNTYTPTWSAYTSGSGLYISSGLLETTPFTIYDGIAKVDIENAGGNWGWSAVARFSDNNTVSFGCVRNGNTGTCRASIYAIGRWK